MTPGEELMLMELLKCTQSCGGKEFLWCGAGNAWEMKTFSISAPHISSMPNP